MAINRDGIIGHANLFWWQPCADGQVWAGPINIAAERRRRGLSEQEWAAVFLNYDNQAYIDGLYFLRRTQVGNLPAKRYHVGNFPPGDVVEVSKWEGLNDCAHFVSECLRAGGVNVFALSVRDLVEKLRARSDTKTLAYLVDLQSAKRIVNAGLLKRGDIIAFGPPNKVITHGHSTIYVANGRVTNHTHLNHPSFTGGGNDYGQGKWEPYAANPDDHPLVILIHFSDGDPNMTNSSNLGWWSTVWQGFTYYYYFQGTGRVTWVRIKPTSLKSGPAVPQGKGYWFEAGNRVEVCWTATGSYEEYTRLAGASTMAGTCNGLPLVLTKMS